MRRTDESSANSAGPASRSGLDQQTSYVDSKGSTLAGEALPYESWTPEQREARLAEIAQLLAIATEKGEQLRNLYDEKAWLQFASQRYQAAIDAWDQHLAMDPSQAQSWYNRGTALDRLGSHELALASYGRVIELQPGNHIAWGNRAIALRKLGRDGEAAEAAKRAFELNPEDMVDSFFKQLRLKQPKLAFILGPLQGLVTRLRGA